MSRVHSGATVKAAALSSRGVAAATPRPHGRGEQPSLLGVVSRPTCWAVVSSLLCGCMYVCMPPAYAVLRLHAKKAKTMAAIAAASEHHMQSEPSPHHARQLARPSCCTSLRARLSRPDEGMDRRDAGMGQDAVAGPSRVHHTAPRAGVNAACSRVDRASRGWGGWKLNSKALFDRARLRELQSYADALAPLGIRRGEPGKRSEALGGEAVLRCGAGREARFPSVRSSRQHRRPRCLLQSWPNGSLLTCCDCSALNRGMSRS